MCVCMHVYIVNFGLAACHMLTKMHRSPLPQTQGWVGGCQLVRATGNDRRSITGLVLEKEAVAQATVEGEAGASTIWCRAPLLNRDFNRENSIPFSACSRESNHRLSPYQVEAGVVSIINNIYIHTIYALHTARICASNSTNKASCQPGSSLSAELPGVPKFVEHAPCC